MSLKGFHSLVGQPNFSCQTNVVKTMKNEKELYVVYSLSVTSGTQATLKPGKPLFFSEKRRAESVIKKFNELYPFLYDEASQGERVYCLLMETYALDSPYRYQLATRVYTPTGVLINDCLVPDDGPFPGRPASAMHHQVGDVVEVPCGDMLLFGIVVGQPASVCDVSSSYGLGASDDCYTIIQHPDMEINYAHAPLVFKPTRTVSKTIEHDLKSAMESYLTSENPN